MGLFPPRMQVILAHAHNRNTSTTPESAGWLRFMVARERFSQGELHIRDRSHRGHFPVGPGWSSLAALSIPMAFLAAYYSPWWQAAC